MQLRKRLLGKSFLYVIIDKDTCFAKDYLGLASKLCRAGAGLVQLRDKNPKKPSLLKEASILNTYLHKTKTLFIVNDYLDIAKLCNADGIHLGQKDIPIEIARAVLGPDKIIGVSCHSLAQALSAQRRGADYVSIGPMLKTPTKPSAKSINKKIIKQAQSRLRIPFFTIGGLNQDNLREFIRLGVRRIAVCRAAVCAKDPFKATRRLSQILRS